MGELVCGCDYTQAERVWQNVRSAARGPLSPAAPTHLGGTSGPHPHTSAARHRNRWEKTTAVAVKIKLKRLGKIRAPYYRIVVADSRTKRDGRAIEEIGKYHPKAEPSFIEVDSERAQHWLSVGAQPTDPVRKILEITGDWQKFKGLPGTEGTLRFAEPKADRKIAFAAALAETLADGGSAAKSKGRAKAGDSGTKAAKAGKAEKTEKAEPAKAEPAKAEPAKAGAAKAEPAKAEADKPAKAEAATADTAKAESAKAEPKADAAKADAAKADAAKAEPAKADAAKAEPKAEPAKAEADKPAKAEKAKAEKEPAAEATDSSSSEG
jgi:small subunit ribosomal protein S16